MYNDNVDDFNPWAEMLQSYLTERDIKPERLAELIGVDAADIYIWLNDVTIPDAGIVEKIALVLKLTKTQTFLFKKYWTWASNYSQDKNQFSL